MQAWPGRLPHRPPGLSKAVRPARDRPRRIRTAGSGLRLHTLLADRILPAARRAAGAITHPGTLCNADAASSLVFTPPEAGYYLIGARIETWEQEDSISPGTPILIVLLQDGEGHVIPNELEMQAKGYTRSVPFSRPVLGLWNLPAEPLTLTFRSGVSRFIFLDYFYLAPIIEAQGSPSFFLPISPWPAQGDWIWGPAMDWAIIAVAAPGAASLLSLQAPAAGEYSLYTDTWHDGTYEHRLGVQIGSGDAARSVGLTLPAGQYWHLESLGTYSLPKGEVSLRFTSDPENPAGAPLAIGAFFLVPRSPAVGELPFSPEARRGDFFIDGLIEEWEGVPVLITDDQGDQLSRSDIRELRVPLSWLSPASWKSGPDTMPPDFDRTAAEGFYLRYRLTQAVEPPVLDETGWAYVGAPDWMQPDTP